jgi:predicted RNase H-like HicB family nuclease
MTTKTFTAVIHQEDDLYVADCPAVDEAIANLREATELYLDEFVS